MELKPLNLFYEEPEPDRWFKFDRYPRKLIRRIIRGKQRPGGVMLIALNLMQGLDKIGVPYRFNDYQYIKRHPEEIACIIGKPHLLFDRKWNAPIILGAGIFSHPIDCPDIFERYPDLKRILVPGDWMQEMFEPYYGNKVSGWPVGIDTEHWSPSLKAEIKTDFLIYDKVRWKYSHYQTELIKPICKILEECSLSYQFIKYGNYSPNELLSKLKNTKSVIFLCEHETQGLAYQQILATGTPILAWDRGGYWQDPYYFPTKVNFRPVSSVPYWDDRCGVKFASAHDFREKLNWFINNHPKFSPRDYIMENLTLEICASKYLEIYQQVEKEIA